MEIKRPGEGEGKQGFCGFTLDGTSTTHCVRLEFLWLFTISFTIEASLFSTQFGLDESKSYIFQWLVLQLSV